MACDWRFAMILTSQISRAVSAPTDSLAHSRPSTHARPRGHVPRRCAHVRDSAERRGRHTNADRVDLGSGAFEPISQVDQPFEMAEPILTLTTGDAARHPMAVCQR